MRELDLDGIHDDGEHLILVDSDGERYTLRIGEALRAATDDQDSGDGERGLTPQAAQVEDVARFADMAEEYAVLPGAEEQRSRAQAGFGAESTVFLQRVADGGQQLAIGFGFPRHVDHL